MRHAKFRLSAAMCVLLASLASCPDRQSTSTPSTSTVSQALEEMPLLSPKRRLRRLHLTLRGREPDLDRYALASTADAEGRLDSFLRTEMETLLASAEFYESMVSWGHDYLGVGDYKRGVFLGGVSNPFGGSHAIKLRPCPATSRHNGSWGTFELSAGGRALVGTGDPISICDAENATVRSVEPWWAPGTTVSVIGMAGSGVTTFNGNDCGIAHPGGDDLGFEDGPTLGCSCGPNLIYCFPTTQHKRTALGNAYDKDSSPFFADSQRRLLYEEPARLFAHIVSTDASFADLVLGTYTVAPRRLQHVYVRWGRQNTANAAVMDARLWWKEATDDWKKVELPYLTPHLLADRNYTYDPTTTPGEPKGLPVAGVLSQLAPNAWYPRERVRAARYLEIFACRNFTAPDPSIVFTPEFVNDPQTQGPCQHCHVTIEPAAIHFKRLEIEDDNPTEHHGRATLGGIGPWKWSTRNVASLPPREPYRRWFSQYLPSTKLTPVTAEQITANPNARFLDYLRPGETLFGLESDGTIGPLGFAKILVKSGEFDRCAVQRIYERFMGRPLDVTTQADLHRSLVEEFVGSGRKVKPLIRTLLTREEFWRGL